MKKILLFLYIFTAAIVSPESIASGIAHADKNTHLDKNTHAGKSNQLDKSSREGSAQPRIKVAVASNNFNVLSINKDKFSGILSSVFQCVFDSSQFQFEFWQFPHARVLQELKEGRMDIGLPLIKTNKRDAFARFTVPIVDSPFIMFTKQRVSPSKKLSELNFVLARMRAMQVFATKNQLNYYEVNNWSEALQLVGKNRFNATIIPEIVSNTFDPNILNGFHKKELFSMPLAMYVSKASPSQKLLVAELNHQIRTCQNNL